MLVPLDGGPLVGPDGEAPAPGGDADVSRFLGWDGERALIAASRGSCGSTDDPGVQAVDPATGDGGGGAEASPPRRLPSQGC